MQARIATITPHDWRNSLSTSIIFFDSFIAIQRFLLPEMRVRISINLIVIRSARAAPRARSFTAIAILFIFAPRSGNLRLFKPLLNFFAHQIYHFRCHFDHGD